MKHPLKSLDVLREPAVRAALAEAWKESKPGLAGGHEEGGFVVLDAEGKLSVQRWPMGEGNRIKVPPHSGCAVGGQIIAATFHKIGRAHV